MFDFYNHSFLSANMTLENIDSETPLNNQKMC